MNFGKMYKKYRGVGMESSCGKTPEFKTFAAEFKRGLNSAAKTNGMEVVEFNEGHFYVSGFVRRADGRLVYFSTLDLRNPNAVDRVMFRFALDEKDYSGKGGFNRFASLDRLIPAIVSEPYWERTSGSVA